MSETLTAIDLDGVERSLDEIMERNNIGRSALYRRLVRQEDGRRRLRPANKPGVKPKHQQAAEAAHE